MYGKLIKSAAAVMICIFAFGNIHLEAAGSTDAAGIDLPARVIDGETYVKAADVAAALGTGGTYDGGAKTYHLNARDAVPQAIAKISPSVVAIIGKPQDVSSVYVDNRFNLAHGTGVVVKADGWIVTNAHVVKDMDQIIVVAADGKQYGGKAVHIDEESDLALVKVEASGLTPAKFADVSKMRTGDTVIAIGTPISFALRNSATEGIISGLDRAVNSSYRLIQTDAAINPGNSGGPLVNLDGEVVGINSMKFVEVDVDSMGFSIPADTVQYVLHQFFQYGKVKRPDIGFRLEESWDALVGLPSHNPLGVSAVDPDSSAAKQGVHKGDFLYSINQQNVSTVVDINEIMKHFLPGDTVTMIFQSNGDLVKRKIVLGEKQ